MRTPGKAMLHDDAFCFAWKLWAATPSWNRQLGTLTCTDSCHACSGTEQQRVLYPNFSQQHNAPTKKRPVLPHCTNLCLCLASHIISWDRACFLGQNPACRQPWTAGVCAWQLLQHLSLLQQPCRTRRQRKGCVCLPWSTHKTALEAKLTQAGL